MEIKDFLLNLEKLNFSLSVKDGKLNLNAIRNKVSKQEIEAVKNNSDIINYITANKDDLIKYLSLLPRVPSRASKNITSIYRLSGLQEGMLFHSLLNVQQGDYVEQFICELVNVNLVAFSAGWAELIKRHSILRTAFHYDTFNIPVQSVYKDVKLPVFEMDHRELDPVSELENFHAYLKADREKGFDFMAPPLMRLTLFRLDADRYRMLWSFHHILFDGWSLPILMGELLSIYELIVNNKALPEVDEDRYEDYIRFLEKRDQSTQESYWRNNLKGLTEGTALPFIRKVKGKEDVKSGLVREILGKSLTADVRNYAKANRITINTLFQGVWAILLNRYTNSDDVLYGVVVSGRPEELDSIEKRVGLFINTIPFRATFDNDNNIVEWLQQLQLGQALSRKNQYAALQDIIRWSEVKSVLFDNLLVFENYPVSDILSEKKWSLQVENLSVFEQTNYPLTILVADAGDITINFNFNAAVLPEVNVSAIANHFRYVLEQLTGGKAETLRDIQLITPAEKLMLNRFNHTFLDLPRGENLMTLFENQVASTPDATAVVFEQESLSYIALNKRANQLARFLQLKRVAADTIVPLCLYRSIEMLVGILGIIKAGGAYLPIDPEYPEERIRYMVKEAGANLVLSSAVCKSNPGFDHTEVFALDTEWDEIAQLEDGNPDNPIAPDQLAYVIYTSGSTGVPKGVMNEHLGLINRLKWTQNYFRLTINDTILQKTTFCFDVSVWELLWPIISGAKLFFAKNAAQGDSTYLKAVINSQNITLLHFVPSMLNLFLSDIEKGDCKTVKHVLCSGEALTTVQLNLFREKLPNAILHNLYGPTEAAIDVTYWSDLAKESIVGTVPIGQPVWNTNIYIVNKAGGINPVDVPGEICIGGIQVARGYLNKPELTAEKFTVNQYGSGRLYHTGDLGRWRQDGNIEYLGRIDAQVKIRGYRVELGEIENIALKSGLLQQIVVLARNDKQDNKQLVAYILAKDLEKKHSLISHLKANLPHYMIPDLWMSLGAFPFTSNGKIDKKALQEVSSERSPTDGYVAPRTETEKFIANLWEELLGVEKVSITDNFFELGGHSLLAMRVVLRLRRELNIAIKIKDLFDYPRFADFSALAAQDKLSSSCRIIPQVRPENIPLSYSQERLWFIDRFEGSTHYHLPAVLRLNGPLDVRALEKSIRQCVDRHEVLRTVIKEHNGQTFQFVKASGKWSLKRTDATEIHDDEYILGQYLKKIVNLPFNLSEDDMIRAELITLGSEQYILAITIHHIAADGWSVPILVQELAANYSAFSRDIVPPLYPLPVQYADYAIWQRNTLTEALLEPHLSYWKTKLDGVSTLRLPPDHKRWAMPGMQGQIFKFTIGELQSKSLEAYGLQHGATLYMTMLAAFNVLLFKYTGQCDICVGTPIANRIQPEVEQLIGFFVNTLALRNYLAEDDVFATLLQRVKKTVLEAHEHQEVPFEKVVEATVKERDVSRTPLFQVMFVLQNREQVQELQLGDIAISAETPAESLAKYDLSFNFQHTYDGIAGIIEYNIQLFEEATIERMAGHYLELINAILASPKGTIGQLNILSDREAQQLQEFNQPDSVYPQDEMLVSLFEKQVSTNGDAIALIFENESVTYKDLNARSNQLAQYLRSIGIVDETPVAIHMERGINMLVAMLGILKSGGAYVPVDIEYPQERVNFILSDTAAPVVITCKSKANKLTGSLQVIEMDGEDGAHIAKEADSNLCHPLKASQLAYIIYTSGSTGRPKGVMIEHENITNYCRAFKSYFDISNNDTVIQQSSISFDTICEEVFPALISGAKIIIVKEGGKDADEIIRLIEHAGASILSTTPSVIAYLNTRLNPPETLRYIISGGELLQPAFIDQLYGKVPVVNTYGPSETTVCATYHLITEIADASFLGRPVLNNQVYIVNGSGGLNPIGIPGEICIGGMQVSRGYLNNPELTAEKFITDKFSGVPGRRLFKTGDVGKWRSDGTIEFIGRMDDQVKIRGYRIEPGETEAVLIQHEEIRQAVVTAQEDENGLKQLIGFVTAANPFRKEVVVAYLKRHLPDYMIPRIWVELDRFPLTPSGKVDRLALPTVDFAELRSVSYTGPRNTLEHELIQIWQDLLGIERIGIYDNFFELGGHSLLIMRSRSQILSKLSLEISVRELFLYSRIADLSERLIQQNPGEQKQTITAVERPEHLPLSYSQERLWFIDKLEGSVQYHLPGVLHLQGRIHIRALEMALRELVNRHEVLRTVFIEHEDKVVQYIKPKDHWELRQHTISDHDKSEDKLKAYISRIVGTPFNLAEDDMLRGDIINLTENEHILVLVVHHIAADAWSLPILVNEVAALYAACSHEQTPSIPELPLQFADYAIWQRNNLDKRQMAAKLKYWEGKLNDVPVLQLPTDKSRLENGAKTGATTLFTIDRDLSRELNNLSKSHEATLYMTLLSAFNVLLYNYTGQDDICVGTSIAGRPHQALEGLIGFFVNTLALRNDVKGDESFIELLSRVKNTTIDAYNHQEVPFEKVVEAVVKERAAGISPLFQVMLVLGNTPEVPHISLGELALSPFDHGFSETKFDLTFFIREVDGEMRCAVQYNSGIFSEVSIDGMINSFRNLLSAIVADPGLPVGQLPMLSITEQKRLLQLGRNVCKYPADSTVADIFEAVAGRHADDSAIIFEGQSITYEQLNARANKLAHYLQRNGVKKNSLVPLFAERGINMIVGIVGILKSGGAYVPIDTDQPEERVKYIVGDTAANLCVSNNRYVTQLSAMSPHLKVIDLDQWDGVSAIEPGFDLEHAFSSDSLAYVIYTSGSTGRPKGVRVTHRNITDYVYGLNDRIRIEECSSFALVSTIATDLGNTVLYSSLFFGGALHLFSKETVSSIDRLHAYFDKNAIDCVKIVPSHWKALSPEEPLVPEKVIIFGGETLTGDVVRRIRQYSDCKIVNHYGPTETTIGKLLYEVTGIDELVPIGRPFSNSTIYVLNKDRQMCPPGVPGQLFIGGHGVAQGYQNLDKLTAERFIPDEFGRPGDRIYQTGDRVRFNKLGNIEYLGRIDDQVKVRGYRVEPAEIGRLLETSELVYRALVVSRFDKQDNNQLVAYVIPVGTFNKDVITRFLKEHLPDYMLPAHIVEIAEIPITASGKTDRNALPDPEAGRKEAALTLLLNETEQKLAVIWKHLLEIEDVAHDDDFFQLGGHSLLAVRLISAVRKEFNVELPISDVFDHPALYELSNKIQSHTAPGKAIIIQKQERPTYIPLSFSQERLWFIDKLEGSLQYHIPIIINLKGKINVSALNYAFRQIVNRHEVLRTIIREQDGRGYQFIKDDNAWNLRQTFISEIESAQLTLEQYLKKQAGQPFDLSQDDMLRAELIQTGMEEYVLMLVMHHIATDGWSASIIGRELNLFYNAYLTGGKKVGNGMEPILPIQYADYAIWQRNHSTGELFNQKLAYWQRKLAGATILQLHADRGKSAENSYRGHTIPVYITQELTQKLNALSRNRGVTLFMTLLSAFKVLLYRYSGMEDICVGSPVAGRNCQEIEQLIGFFVNTVVLRSKVSGEESFVDLLEQVKINTIEAYDNQDVPFEKVVEAVVKQRDWNVSPLFQVMFALQNTPTIGALRLGDLELTSGFIDGSYAKFKISLSLSETAEGIQGGLEFNTDIFDQHTIEQMIGNFLVLLQAIAADPEAKIGHINILTEKEAVQQLKQFNSRRVLYPTDKNIVTLFEEQARKTPHATAIIFNNHHICYNELNNRANQLARYIVSFGIPSESLIPIFIDRGPEMIVAILAVLKAGCAYVPLDTSSPKARVNYILSDIGADFILSAGVLSVLPDNRHISVIDLNRRQSEIASCDADNLNLGIEPAQLAYVIYTSGSTGQPKGVMVEHRSLINLSSGQSIALGIGEGTKVLQFASVGFDASCNEIFTTLLSGGCLITCPQDTLLSAEDFNLLISTNNVELAILPPAFQQFLGKTPKSLKTLISAGEALNETTTKRFQNQKVKVVNGYGPTEATVCATMTSTPILEDGTITIGKPIDNVTIYILNTQGQLNPLGVTGEICIGGIQVARGYLHQPDLNAEKFIYNPFSTDTFDRLYRTGDFGRWLRDGNIEYIGRSDDQVKIRGFRVELGEIEHALIKSGMVEQAVVIANGDNDGINRLIAYFTKRDAYKRQDLINYLTGHLPDYMMPSIWIPVEHFDLTPNGKVDKNRLPGVKLSEQDMGLYTAPRNALEDELAAIWENMLNVERIGVNDNFFELGGHSIMAMRLLSTIRKNLGINFTVRDLFVNPTVARLANQVDRSEQDNYRSLIPLRTHGNKRPLYMICGAGGTVFTFRQFASMLDPDQPVYGLQQPLDIKSADEFPDTIEGIAELYVTEIIKQNPVGPYALSGHCLGGIIALEVASQLKTMGKNVDMLAMFDAEAKPLNTAEPGPSFIAFLKKALSVIYLKVEFEWFLLRKHPKQALMYKFRKMDTFLKSFEPRLVNIEQDVFDQVTLKIKTASEKYKMKYYDDEIIIFNATQQFYFIDKVNKIIYKELSVNHSGKHAWADYAKSIMIHKVKGEHSTIFDGENASDFSKILQSRLDKGADL